MPTALITGSTAGIGAGFADRYARLGHDLVLVARNAERLRDQATDLSARWHVDVEVLPADLGTDEGCAAVETRAADEGRPIDVLVNNAGFTLGADFVHSGRGRRRAAAAGPGPGADADHQGRVARHAGP